MGSLVRILFLACLVALQHSIALGKTAPASNEAPIPASPLSCKVVDGPVINNTLENPYLVKDPLTCRACYCIEPQADDDNIEERDAEQMPQAECLVADCAAPPCVNPIRNDSIDQCCPICPEGSNCFLRCKEEQKYWVTIPGGKPIRRTSGSICECPPDNYDYIADGSSGKKRFAKCRNARADDKGVEMEEPCKETVA